MRRVPSAPQSVHYGSSGGGIGCGVLIGFPIAALCSWTLNHSILWAALHGLFWWAYLPYLCLGCGGGIPALPW